MNLGSTPIDGACYIEHEFLSQRLDSSKIDWYLSKAHADPVKRRLYIEPVLRIYAIIYSRH